MFAQRGNVTHERITLKDTVFGSVIFAVGSIILRGIMLLIIIGWLLLIGRGSGPLLVFSVLIHTMPRPRWRPIRIAWQLIHATVGRYRQEQHKILSLLTWLGLISTLAWVTGYWPALRWQIGAGRLWVILARRSLSLGPFWLWLRLAVIVSTPWMLWEPGKWLAWTFKMEQIAPKVREAIGLTLMPQHIDSPIGELRERRSSVSRIVVEHDNEPLPPDAQATMLVEGE